MDIDILFSFNSETGVQEQANAIEQWAKDNEISCRFFDSSRDNGTLSIDNMSSDCNQLVELLSDADKYVLRHSPLFMKDKTGITESYSIDSCLDNELETDNTEVIVNSKYTVAEDEREWIGQQRLITVFRAVVNGKIEDSEIYSKSEAVEKQKDTLIKIWNDNIFSSSNGFMDDWTWIGVSCDKTQRMNHIDIEARTKTGYDVKIILNFDGYWVLAADTSVYKEGVYEYKSSKELGNWCPANKIDSPVDFNNCINIILREELKQVCEHNADTLNISTD